MIGKPVAMMLLQENSTVTICHSRTKDIAAVAKDADVLIAAVGQAKMVTPDFVNPGQVIIDVGINVDDEGKLTGDVDYDAVEPRSKGSYSGTSRCRLGYNINFDETCGRSGRTYFKLIDESGCPLYNSNVMPIYIRLAKKNDSCCRSLLKICSIRKRFSRAQCPLDFTLRKGMNRK